MTKELVFEGTAYPIISIRKNGDRLIGYANTVSAEDLYAAATPPVHGVAKGTGGARVAAVRIGDLLRIDRRGDHWFVSDDAGALGRLNWSRADEGRPYALAGKPIHFPDSAILEVRRLVVNTDGQVVNFAGMTTTATAAIGGEGPS